MQTKKEIDCGDSSCLFAENKSGMRTNGGCMCLVNYGFFRSSIKSVTYMLREIIALREENERLHQSLNGNTKR